MTTLPLIVAKFGGSSVRDAEAINRSAKVALEKKARIVVVSATYGTTNTLVEFSNKSGSWEQAQEKLAQLKDRHLTIAQQLKSSAEEMQQIEELIDSLERTVELRYFKEEYLNAEAIKDAICSMGERISSVLMRRAMENLASRPVELLDVRKIVKTDGQFTAANPLIDVIAEEASRVLPNIRSEETLYVTQGFLGQTISGATTTLGRGGSDLSATLIAEAIDADEVQIWTDVPGVATTDPRVCDKAQSIDEMTYVEASEMAVFGAKVLHPTTLLPASRKNIPVFVGSSLDMNAGGTWIREKAEKTPVVRGIALKNKQRLITLTTPKMVNSHNFLFNVFQIFNEEQVSVDLISTSQISVSFTFDDSSTITDTLLGRLSDIANVKVEDNFSLISLVGNGMNYTPNISKQVFTALEGINIRLICLGASQYNFCFLVDGENAPEAIKRLHGSFMECV
jgi:aspartate kinase